MMNLNFINRSIIFLYLVIPYLPLFGEIDRIASQWFFLSIVNLIALPVLYFKGKINFLKAYKESKPLIIFSFFLIFCIISIFDAINFVESSIEFFRYSSVFLGLFLFNQFILKSKKNLHFLFVLIAIFLSVECFGIYLQYFQGLPLIGFTGNKNIASASLIIKSVLFIYTLFKYDNVFSKLLSFLLLSLVYFAVLLIGSKAGILSLSILLVILLATIIFRYKIFKLFIIPIISILLMFFCSTLTNDNLVIGINNTIDYTKDRGNTDRLRYFSQSIETFKDHFINGIGLGNWKIYSSKYDSKFMTDYIVQYHTHNDFLQFFAEIGIGAILYLFFFFITFKYSITPVLKIKKSVDKYIPIYVLSFVALSFYFLDANLNFPASRVIMQLNLIIIFSIISNLKSREIEEL